jgi:hypothetical protein
MEISGRRGRHAGQHRWAAGELEIAFRASPNCRHRVCSARSDGAESQQLTLQLHWIGVSRHLADLDYRRGEECVARAANSERPLGRHQQSASGDGVRMQWHDTASAKALFREECRMKWAEVIQGKEKPARSDSIDLNHEEKAVSVGTAEYAVLTF